MISGEMECDLCGEEFNMNIFLVEHMSVMHSQKGKYLQSFGKKTMQMIKDKNMSNMKKTIIRPKNHCKPVQSEICSFISVKSILSQGKPLTQHL